MLTSRELPSDEWHRLAHTELAPALGHLKPSFARVVVVEDGDAIVACWAGLIMLHVEGAWIDPAYRKQPGVCVRLWRQMHKLAASWGASQAITGSASDEVTLLLQRHGATPLHMQEWVLCL